MVSFPTPVSPLIRRVAVANILLTILTAPVVAQPSSVPSSSVDPRALVRKAVDNEIEAAKNPSARFMFRSTRTTSRGSVTKIFVETKEATAGIVVAYNGKALTPEQRQEEFARIRRFTKNPEELEKKRRQEQQDAERTTRIVRALPDAFLYEYAGQQMGSPGIGKPGDPLVVLKFRPNPDYEPPSRIEQVLTGMEGVLMLDVRSNRLASMDGTLFREVAFGWGVLGHLNKGGHFLVHQQEVGDQCWSISSTSLAITGKVLFVKNLVFDLNEVFSDFKPVPAEITFAQAIERLEKEEAVYAENAPAGTPEPSAR